MARIELAPGVLDDFERILGHLDRHGSAGGPSRVEAILQAIDLLAHSPLVGRPVRGGLRELARAGDPGAARIRGAILGRR